ncbi:MAG: hypothetical protein ABIL89_08015 [candidate division WOR-3 bacterium]
MSEEEFKDLIKTKNGVCIIPKFEELEKEIHPAIDIVDDLAYVSVYIPCIIFNEKDVSKRKTKNQLFFIFSNRTKEIVNSETLKKHNWKLKYAPIQFPNKWSLKSVEEYLNGKSVNPKEIYEEVKNVWDKYIEFPDGVYSHLATLYTIGSYFFHIFNTYPYLYIGGVKGSGKTKILTIFYLLCFNAIFSMNISTSALFRLIQSGRCCVLIDESEELSNPERRTDFRSMLLSGYKKGILVYRTEKKKKEQLVPEGFEVYSPKILANIRGLELVLEDRCITIIMKKGIIKEKIDLEPKIEDPIWQKIRDDLYIFFLTYWKKIKSIYENEKIEIPEIHERHLELWKPILVLAKFFSLYVPIHTLPAEPSQPSLYDIMKDLAIQKVKEKITENLTESAEIVLIQALFDLVKEDNYYKVSDIRKVMSERYEGDQKWLSNEWIGRALKRLGFSDKRRLGKGIEYKISPEQVLDLASRMGIELEFSEGSERTEGSEGIGIYGICEFCGKTEEVKEVYFTKLNRKKFICNKCLSEFPKDQYEIIINKDKEKEDDTQVSNKIDEEIDRLIFENKIKTITSQGLKLFICNKCNNMFFGKEDILEHLKTHERREENA